MKECCYRDYFGKDITEQVRQKLREVYPEFENIMVGMAMDIDRRELSPSSLQRAAVERVWPSGRTRGFWGESRCLHRSKRQEKEGIV